MQRNLIDERMKEYTPEVLAEKIGVSKNTIYRWKREENIKSMIDFIHLLKLLEIDPFEYLKIKKG